MPRRLAAALVLAVALALLVAGGITLRRLRAPAPPSTPGPIAPPSAPPRPLAQGRPNLVLVIACTLRRDQLSPYGAPPEVSPFLQALADGGVRFADAVDAAPWTRAASTAVLTGHHAIEVGMIEPAETSDNHRLSPTVVTLAERLRDAGYETLGVTANPNLNAVFGFDQGYDRYHEAQALWRDQYRGEAEATEKPTVDQVVDAALALVDGRERPDAPLYLRVVTLDTHEPIELDRRAARRFVDDGVPSRVGKYRFAVNTLDAGLRRLWEALGARGYSEENTVLVVVNDHGEGLQFPPEHGKGHGNFVLPSAVEMPWLVYGHGVARGHVVAGMASQVDVSPTVLGLLGVTSPYTGEGRDWSAAVRGERDHTDRAEAYVDTWFQRANRAAVYTSERFCMHDFSDLAEREGRQRLHPKTACYDRKTDPLAQAPLEVPDRELLDQLFRWRGQALEANAAWPDEQRVSDVDPVRDQLEALGYAEGEEGVPEAAGDP